MTVINPEDLKKQWLITLPGIIFLVASFWYVTFLALPELIDQLLLQPPIIRVFPGLTLWFFFGPLSFLLIIIYLLIHIPGGIKHIQKLERVLLFLVFINFLATVLILLCSTPVLNYFMPKIGYTECEVLEGKPSIWFSDWVKNPQWCVKGKSPEWVFEQAGFPGSLAR